MHMHKRFEKLQTGRKKFRVQGSILRGGGCGQVVLPVPGLHTRYTPLYTQRLSHAASEPYSAVTQ